MSLPPARTLTDAGECLPVLLAFVEGRGTAGHAAHAATVVIDYVVSVALPDPTPLALPDHKSALQVAAGQANSGMLSAINWQQILQVALSILTQILAGG